MASTISHKSKKKAEDTRSITSRRSTVSKTSKSKRTASNADTQSITSKKGKKKQGSRKPAKDSDEGNLC